MQRTSLGATSSSPTQPLDERHLLEAISGRMPRVGTSLLYTFALLLSALLMLMLLAVYFALIAGLGYLVYLHATSNIPEFSSRMGTKGIVGALGAYIVPIIVGGFLVLMLVKPLFAPRKGIAVHPRRLRREEEPLLFAFVDRISDAIGAPRPRIIQVDAEVNASAGSGRGLGGLLRGGVILTIGLPLVAGLSLQGLGGIIAHELGHFNQGVGTRLFIIVHRLNQWFGQIVYERDAWDEFLARMRAEADHPLLALLVALLQAAVWLIRRVLALLMLIGHAGSCYLLRQREFDADLREIQFAGSAAFEKTSDELKLLEVAHDAAMHDLSSAWRQRRLGDDFAALIMQRRNQLRINPDDRPREEPPPRPRLFDTHPPTVARIRRARAVGAPGMFHDPRPATLLFKDFKTLSRQVSLDMYVEIVGALVKPSTLIPSEQIAAQAEQREEDLRALQRFTFNYFTPLRPLLEWGEYITAPPDPQACAREIKLRREQLEDRARTIGEGYEAFELAWNRHMAAQLLYSAHKEQIRIALSNFSVPMRGAEHPEQMLELTRQELLEADGPLKAFELELRERLFAALRLLHVPQLAARMPEAANLRKPAQDVIDALAGLSGVRDGWTDFVIGVGVIKGLLNEAQGGDNEGLVRRILATRSKLCRQAGDLFKLLSPVAYPFDHGSGKVSMAVYIFPEMPDPEDLASFMHTVEGIARRLLSFQREATGRLTCIAEQVEGALGLRPMITDQLRSGKFDF